MYYDQMPLLLNRTVNQSPPNPVVHEPPLHDMQSFQLASELATLASAGKFANAKSNFSNDSEERLNKFLSSIILLVLWFCSFLKGLNQRAYKHLAPLSLCQSLNKRQILKCFCLYFNGIIIVWRCIC